MTSKNLNALDRATVPPAKAGTPNPVSASFSQLTIKAFLILVFLIGRLSEHKKKDDDDASDEQECVGLEITRLNEAQRAAKQFGAAMRAAHHQAGDDPAVKPIR